jgi:hypothetical protein
VPAHPYRDSGEVAVIADRRADGGEFVEKTGK